MATVTGNSNNPGEPGVRGDSTQFNGVLGASTAGGHAGVAGVNESGGNGIFGRGTGNGVFGIHSGADGAGVVGTSDQNDGVRGFSAASAHSGVVGTNTGRGVGVLGQSAQGLAGKFEGNVVITGSLTVQGVSIQSLLQRIQQLEQKVAALSSGSGGTPQQAFVSCVLETVSIGDPHKRLRIGGTGFKAGEQVSLKITSKVEGGNPVTQIHETTANPFGGIDFAFGSAFCGGFPPQKITFQVQGTGLTSNKVSNIATAGC